jgi:UTP--glucose-1-phosphate uridylyltransferase
MVQLAVEEALSSNIKDIGIVIRRGKETIRDYINSLMTSSDPIWENLRQELSQTRVHYIFQEKPLGLGNAIYEAREYIDDSPFVMIIPDQFLDSRTSATKQLLNAAKKDFQAVWSSLTVVPPEEREFFSGTRSFLLTNRRGNTCEVKEILEQSRSQSGETLLGFGRTYFPQGVIEFFSDRFMNPVTREVDLLFTFKALMKEYRNHAVMLEGKSMDFGTWAGYEHFFSATVTFNEKCNLGSFSFINIYAKHQNCWNFTAGIFAMARFLRASSSL